MFLALSAVILWLTLKPKPSPVLPPEIVACRALEKLQARPEDGNVLSEVSRILRRYVIAAFELPAAELTTAEFCGALAANEKIGAELAQAISAFLRECDERKFSLSPAGAPLTAATRALELIAGAEKQRAKISIQTNLGNQ